MPPEADDPSATHDDPIDTARASGARDGASIACIRCGHDLRAKLARWETECPLVGTCAECGLEFGWRELLSTAHRLPIWNVEAIGGRRPWPWRWLVHTWMVAVRPRAVFRSLSMKHPPRWGRLLPATLPGLLLVVLVAGGLVVSAQRQAGLGWRTSIAAGFRLFSDQPVQGTVPYSINGYGRQFPPGFLVAWDPTSGSTSVTSVASLTRPLGEPESRERFLTDPQGIRYGLTYRSTHYLRYVEGVDGPVLVQLWPSMMPTPQQRARIGQPLLVPLGGPAPRSVLAGLMPPLLAFVLPLALLPIFCGIVFLLLPATRRGGRVRGGHVVRLTVYGLMASIPLAMIVVALIFLVGPMLLPGGPRPNSEWAYRSDLVANLRTMGILGLIVGAIWIWPAWWCLAAVRDHLRLGPAKRVALTIAFVGALASFVMSVLVQQAIG